MADPKKPGWKTSELWLGVVASLLSTFFAAGVIPSSGVVAQVAVIAAFALTSLGYTVTRGRVKVANAGGTGSIKEMAVGQLIDSGGKLADAGTFETTTRPGG